MKLLWLCNIIPAAVQQKIDGRAGNGLWLDNMLRDLRQQGHNIRVLCRGNAFGSGSLDENCSYTVFEEKQPQVYEAGLEALFQKEIQQFQPDVIHIWGTEYAHSLAMVNAAEKESVLDRAVISIQGLCSVYARHYAEGVPAAVQLGGTLRDFLRRDNIANQAKTYAQRGEFEVKALEKARHVIGRTDWDRACAQRIHPDIRYHFCNETLREVFFEDCWSYDQCVKHSVFASSCSYPVKGFHYLLEAMAEVVKHYPDAAVYVTGDSFLSAGGWKGKLRQTGYKCYLAALAKKYGLQEKLHFLGSLNAQQMKDAFLRANVFAMPSTIENSPNSLGEAMLLGVPCVVSDVGGVTNMIAHGQEGYVYPSTAPYMLSHYIQEIFAMEEKAEQMGIKARMHARKTHDPETNLETLLAIYRKIGE